MTNVKNSNQKLTKETHSVHFEGDSGVKVFILMGLLVSSPAWAASESAASPTMIMGMIVLGWVVSLALSWRSPKMGLVATGLMGLA